MFPFKRKPKLKPAPPRRDLLLHALALANNLGKRVAELEQREVEHAEAIDKLGERFGVEYLEGEWIGKRYLKDDDGPAIQDG